MTSKQNLDKFFKEEISYQQTNRDKSKIATKSGKHWCDNCDRNHVGKFGKCSLCGFIEHKNKIKGQ